MRLSIQRRIPPKSGYETRQFARSIAQSTVQYLLKQHAAHSLCNRPFDRLDCKFLPASCNVAAQRQEREEKDSFTVSLSCRRPREPGTSLHPRRNQRPSTINPNLIRLPSKRPFFSPRHTVRQEHSTLPETRIHSHTSALLDHRLASMPMLEPRLVGNISWCAHRCDVRIHTSSTANGFKCCRSALMQKQATHLDTFRHRLSVLLLSSSTSSSEPVTTSSYPSPETTATQDAHHNRCILGPWCPQCMREPETLGTRQTAQSVVIDQLDTALVSS